MQCFSVLARACNQRMSNRRLRGLWGTARERRMQSVELLLALPVGCMASHAVTSSDAFERTALLDVHGLAWRPLFSSFPSLPQRAWRCFMTGSVCGCAGISRAPVPARTACALRVARGIARGNLSVCWCRPSLCAPCGAALLLGGAWSRSPRSFRLLSTKLLQALSMPGGSTMSGAVCKGSSHGLHQPPAVHARPLC